MSASCGHPVPWARLVDYWAHDLSDKEVDEVDAHLMGCESCTIVSAGVASITQAVRQLLPPVITRAKLAELQASGLRVAENPIRPGERKLAVFGPHLDLLVHRLGGLSLEHAQRVSITLSVEETGDVLVELPEVPFDRDSGEVLIACQRHYSVLPPNIVAEVRAHGAAGVERVDRYEIPHLFE